MPAQNQRISEYVLDAQIGAGTFGQVWRARHHVWTDQLVAIKIPTDAQYVRNLQQEGAAIHGLEHPNIVRAIGFDPYADPAYLVMEYVPGTSLRQLIVDRKVQIADVVSIMKQVLAGLGYAHRNGVLHRDIKPENILIHQRASADGYSAEGVVKVTDFGLGRAATKTAVGSIVYSQSIGDPAGKEIAGTLDYMAPEQRSGGEVGPRADLYACGVVLYELLTGERPAGTELPSDLNRNVPRHLDEAFRRSYARLEKRFQDAEEFANALTPVAPPTIGAPVFPQTAGAGSTSGLSTAGQMVTCPTCNGKGQKPGADWDFCDICRGSGKLYGDTPGIEVKCGKCRGSGTLPPAKCETCHGRGRVPATAAPQRFSGTLCPSCRHPVEPTDQFCMNCGVQLVAIVRRCPKCGAYPDSSDRYCIFCGEGLAAEVRA